MGKWDPVVVHQRCRQFRRAIQCPRLAVTTMLAHFNSHGFTIAGPVKISVLTTLTGRNVLHRHVFLNREVPAKVTDRSPTKRATAKRLGVGPGIPGVILGAVNGDIGRLHWPVFSPSVASTWNVTASHIDRFG